MADVTPTEELAPPEAAPTTRWPRALRAFRHRDFLLFWIGMVVSVTGTWMQNLAQGWLVMDLTPKSVHSLYAALVGVCGTAPMLLFTLPAGVVADRIRKRNLVMLTQTLAMFQAFVLAALVYTHVVRVWHVMILAACLGTINAFDMPTRQAMTLELISREDAFNAVSLNSSAFNLGRIAGPGLAGPLIVATGLGGCFLINALSFLAIIFALVAIPARPPAAKRQGSMIENIREGAAWARGEPVPRTLLLMTAVGGIFAMPYTTLMPVFAKDIFHTDPRGLSILMTTVGVGALCAAVGLASTGHRWRMGAAATVGSLLFPLALLGLCFAPTYLAAVLSLFVVGLGFMTFNAVSNSMLQIAPPNALRGRVMSLRAFVFAGMSPIGAAQIGAVATGLSAFASLRLVGLLGFAGLPPIYARALGLSYLTDPAAEQYGPRGAVGLGAAICLLMALYVVWRRPRVRASEDGL